MGLRPLPAPTGRAQRLVGLLRGWLAVVLLFPSLIVINGLQTSSLLLRPLSPRAFRGFNRWAANTWWGWCVTMSRHLQRIRVEVTGDPIPTRENAIVVVNHQEMSDVTFLFFFARAKERLGDLKWFVKDVIKWVPGVGWGMVFLGCVFVRRNWTADRQSIQRTFSHLVDNRVPVWLVSFCEGTRITPEKVVRSQAYAKKAGLPPTERVLLPRTKGFVASVQGLGAHLEAVYDVTIGHPGGAPTLWQYIQGFARVGHLHVRRYPANTLPEGEEALADWLLERFREKDRLLAGFEEAGSFPGG